jgi:hypothetical protein
LVSLKPFSWKWTLKQFKVPMEYNLICMFITSAIVTSPFVNNRSFDIWNWWRPGFKMECVDLVQQM